jgi:hypothetical protein
VAGLLPITNPLNVSVLQRSGAVLELVERVQESVCQAMPETGVVMQALILNLRRLPAKLVAPRICNQHARPAFQRKIAIPILRAGTRGTDQWRLAELPSVSSHSPTAGRRPASDSHRVAGSRSVYAVDQPSRRAARDGVLNPDRG